MHVLLSYIFEQELSADHVDKSAGFYSACGVWGSGFRVGLGMNDWQFGVACPARLASSTVMY